MKLSKAQRQAIGARLTKFADDVMTGAGFVVGLIGAIYILKWIGVL